jgi:hypothetical protein
MGKLAELFNYESDKISSSTVIHRFGYGVELWSNRGKDQWAAVRLFLSQEIISNGTAKAVNRREDSKIDEAVK